VSEASTASKLHTCLFVTSTLHCLHLHSPYIITATSERSECVSQNLQEGKQLRWSPWTDCRSVVGVPFVFHGRRCCDVVGGGGDTSNTMQLRRLKRGYRDGTPWTSTQSAKEWFTKESHTVSRDTSARSITYDYKKITDILGRFSGNSQKPAATCGDLAYWTSAKQVDKSRDDMWNCTDSCN
jgi:hypothetical protein